MLEYMNPFALLEADDSVLVVIDVQDTFLNKLSPQESSSLLAKIVWVTRLAQWRQVPLLITAEEPKTQPVAAKVLQSLPVNTPIHEKHVFGLADQANLLETLQQTGRKTMVLVGLETDVCVMHSALGLLEHGFRVAVICDAVGTPAPGQELGLRRMEQAGVTITNIKGVFYEWLRTVEAINRFHDELPDMRELADVML
jgi:nicotinamidase-related amidase